MIFQQSMTSLTLLLTLGRRIAEAMVQFDGLAPREAGDRTIETLRFICPLLGFS